jgi:hypothetical protein
MQAPVYRNAGAQNTFMGLAFPLEVLIVIATFWPASLLGPGPGAAVTLAVYVALRALSHGRPDSYVQHWLMQRARRALYGGRLAAAARSHTPMFPFGPYQVRRDAPKEKP